MRFKGYVIKYSLTAKERLTMSAIIRFIFIMLSLFLASCANHHIIIIKDKADVTACKVLCQHRLVACGQTCHDNRRLCGISAKATAARAYRQYQHEEFVKGGFIARDLNSYRNLLQCRKTTCNCHADYDVCYQSCTGVIHKSLQVPPACNL